MPEAILVLLRHPEELDLLLGAATRLAQVMGRARINALAIRDTIHLVPAGAVTLADRSDAILAAQDDERERVAALRASFDVWKVAMRGGAAEAHWFDAEGDATELVVRWGRRADVIIVGRPSRGDVLGRQALHTALFGTARPILMMPPGPAEPEFGEQAVVPVFGRRIAIAWRNDRQAMRAVLPALRWFADAEQVHVLMGVRAAAAPPEIPPILAEHGLVANVHVLAIHPAPFGRTLLDAAHRLSADLLVMGAYAHSPLRELVLGGVTRHMLAHADLPVLMRH